jgi:2-polyprenyl-6-methoxyphenol hydroxylase-like FAD-dependent oxidoreductase
VKGGVTATYVGDLNAGVEEYSPSRRLFVAQDALEPILRKRAEELGASMRYGAEVASVQETGDGVTAEVRDRASGEVKAVRAQYLVAADGWRSPIRRQLGIDMHGYGLLSKSATIYFRADCARLLEGTDLGVIYVFNPGVRGFFRFERSGESGFLAVNTLGDPREPGALDVTKDMSPELARDLVRTAIGVDDIPVEIDDVAHWDATADVADRYQVGRIFLTGDAVHALPPNGGFGGNTGMQDAHNLAWKLAMAVKGTAGEELLATYDAERRPIGEQMIEQAYTRYATRVTPEVAGDDIPPFINDLWIEIGYRYRSSAVIPDGDDEGPIIDDPHAISGQPGTRAPHVGIDSGSTIDLSGRGFALLAGADGAAWAEAAEGLPVDAHVLPGIEAAYGITPAGAALVRPDGFVAFRSRDAVAEPAETLRNALSEVLGSPVTA